MIPFDWLLYGGMAIAALVLFGIAVPSCNNKKWRVGNHRVKKRTRTRKHHHGYNIHKKETYYVCVDCEKKKKKRKYFYDEKCYEVID